MLKEVFQVRSRPASDGVGIFFSVQSAQERVVLY